MKLPLMRIAAVVTVAVLAREHAAQAGPYELNGLHPPPLTTTSSLANETLHRCMKAMATKNATIEKAEIQCGVVHRSSIHVPSPSTPQNPANAGAPDGAPKVKAGPSPAGNSVVATPLPPLSQPMAPPPVIARPTTAASDPCGSGTDIEQLFSPACLSKLNPAGPAALDVASASPALPTAPEAVPCLVTIFNAEGAPSTTQLTAQSVKQCLMQGTNMTYGQPGHSNIIVGYDSVGVTCKRPAPDAVTITCEMMGATAARKKDSVASAPAATSAADGPNSSPSVAPTSVPVAVKTSTDVGRAAKSDTVDGPQSKATSTPLKEKHGRQPTVTVSDDSYKG